MFQTASRFIATLGLVAGVTACESTESRVAHIDTPNARVTLRCDGVASERDTTCVLFGPSLIELLARTDAYDGKRVRVIGFANLEFEGNALYVSREDYEHMIPRNGFWLDVPDSLLRGRTLHLPGYFLIEGVVSAHDRGHMGLWSGAIGQVSRFDPALSRAGLDSQLRRGFTPLPPPPPSPGRSGGGRL